MGDRKTGVDRRVVVKRRKSGFLLMVVAVISACSAGAPSNADLEQMLTNAKTASDHDKIAAYYQEEATEAQSKYEQHKALAAQYQRNLRWGGWAQHCDHLAQDYKNAQEDASWLAALHRKIAEEKSSADTNRPIAGGSNGAQDH